MRTLLMVAILSLGVAAQAQLGGKPWNIRDQIGFSTLANGIQSQFQSSSFDVLASENDLQRYWTRLTGQAPSTAPRGTDWGKQKVIAIALGQRSSGGYSVVVQNIEKSGPNSVIVRAVEITPTRGQWVSQSITSPYILVKVDRTAGQLSLDLQKRTNSVGNGVTITGPGVIVLNPNNYDRPGGGGVVDPKNAVDWSPFRSGRTSLITEQVLWVFDSESDYRRYAEKATGRPLEGNSGIDWRNQRLVALHLGRRPSSGFRLLVTNVERSGQTGIIRAVEETPLAGSWVARKPSYPYTLVLVPRNLANFKVDLSQREGKGDARIIDGG